MVTNELYLLSQPKKILVYCCLHMCNLEKVLTTEKRPRSRVWRQRKYLSGQSIEFDEVCTCCVVDAPSLGILRPLKQRQEPLTPFIILLLVRQVV